MTNFFNREKSLEDKYQNDKLLEFKIQSRRNRLLGLWVGEKISMSPTQVEDYARQIVNWSVEHPGVDNLVNRVLLDLETYGIQLSEHLIRKQLEYCHQDAMEQILQE